jgi:F0F1-type ATP synthase membrane subunit b/b'
VVIFVGDALNSLLQNRKELILNQLTEAKNKAEDVEKKLREAKNKFQAAKVKSQEIYNQISLTVQNDNNQLELQTQDTIQRLKSLKKETLLFQQQKITKQISQHIIQLALKQVQAKLVSRMNSGFQLSMNNFYIALFCNYQ